MSCDAHFSTVKFKHFILVIIFNQTPKKLLFVHRDQFPFTLIKAFDAHIFFTKISQTFNEWELIDIMTLGLL